MSPLAVGYGTHMGRHSSALYRVLPSYCRKASTAILPSTPALFTIAARAPALACSTSDRGVIGGSSMRSLALIASLLAASPAALADRYVWVNGQRMAPADIAYLERLRCGPIPDGRYWLNVGSGIWGYAGNPRPQGPSPSRAARQRRASHESPRTVRRLHERWPVLVRERRAGRALLSRSGRARRGTGLVRRRPVHRAFARTGAGA